MSGEAYELPETRMELHEPSLDPIEEGCSAVGTGSHFLEPGKVNLNKVSTTSLTSLGSIEGALQDVELTVLHHPSSGWNPQVKPKIRKKASSQVETLYINQVYNQVKLSK